MLPPSLIQLRDKLGRELVQQPDSPLLHHGLRVLTRAVERRDVLNPWQKLAAARATALALDVATHARQPEGAAAPLWCDLLDPTKQPALAWWNKTTPPRHTQLAGLLDAATESARLNSATAGADVAQVLELTYQALGPTPPPKTSKVGLVGAAIGLGVGFMLARRRGGK